MRDRERLAQLHPAHAQQCAPQADATADVNVNRVRAKFGYCGPLSPGVSHLPPSVIEPVCESDTRRRPRHKKSPAGAGLSFQSDMSKYPT